MTEFPQAVTLPKQVHAARNARSKDLIHSARIGIGLRLLALLLESAGILFVHSSALYLDVLSGLMDLMSTVFLIICLKLACRPPDRDHPFGHGRYEPIGGLILSVVITLLGFGVFGKQLFAFFDGRELLYVPRFSWLFPAGAMAALEISHQFLKRAAKRSDSPALAAEAIHYRLDSITSFLALAALYAAGTWPDFSFHIDHIGAIAIALFMIGMGLFAAKGNFDQLMDRAPDSRLFECVREAAVNTPGVEGTEKIRIQQYGPDAHVDIDIEVEPGLSVDTAHKISQQVRAEIQKAWPSVRDVTVHIEPFYANDH